MSGFEDWRQKQDWSLLASCSQDYIAEQAYQAAHAESEKLLRECLEALDVMCGDFDSHGMQKISNTAEKLRAFLGGGV